MSQKSVYRLSSELNDFNIIPRVRHWLSREGPGAVILRGARHRFGKRPWNKLVVIKEPGTGVGKGPRAGSRPRARHRLGKGPRTGSNGRARHWLG